MMIDSIDKQSYNANIYNAHLSYGITHPLVPMYGSSFTDSINPDPFKSDSGLTYSLSGSRKRSRDSSFSGDRNPIDRCAPFTFLGEDISSQIQQQELEIDQFISHHTEKVKAEIEYRRKRNSFTIISALEEAITNRLRAKEDDITKLTKLNYVLEEKVKSLCVETQIWRELALTNEATANALRTNLKQVLENVTTARETDTPGDAGDIESCCESNNENERMLAEQDSGNRMCKSCWKAESCVLLLPCRHLCLCTVCASSINICPICKSTKKISVNVNM